MMDARRLFAAVGFVTLVACFVSWLATSTGNATLWVGGWLLLALAARH